MDQQPHRHLNRRFKHAPVLARLAVLAALAAGVSVGAAGCSRGSEGDAQAKAATDKAGDKAGDKATDAVPVEVVAAARRPIAASYAGTAPLEPRAESQVVAKTSGVALQVLVEEGQHVRAGQVLVKLDPDRARLQAAQSAAQVRKLEANYARSKALEGQRLISANDIDQLKFDLENARAVHNLASLEASYSSVQAPIDGVIASRSIKPGNFVQINTPIFRIVDVSRLEATLNVPEREIATLKAGQPVTLQVDAMPGRVFRGSVDRVAPVVDAGSGTFRVVCAFDGRATGTAVDAASPAASAAASATLQGGMFGRIRIDYDQRADALVVPRLALLDDQADPAVYAVRSGKAVRVPVTLGYTDGEWAEVVRGLKVGDAVVTAGKVALRDGAAVQVIAAPAARTVAAAAAAGAAK